LWSTTTTGYPLQNRNITLGYHYNPIEPSDWSDGPHEGPVCDTCGGVGEVMSMVCYGGPPIEQMQTCPDCDGLGFHEPESDDIL